MATGGHVQERGLGLRGRRTRCREEPPPHNRTADSGRVRRSRGEEAIGSLGKGKAQRNSLGSGGGFMPERMEVAITLVRAHATLKVA
jgi:hypothetical protein